MTISDPDLRKAIEEFYLPRHLVKAIYDIGTIPAHSQESHVGVGFIDIADYTYLSKFLSPKENQILLNGLYTAFQIVLERHGGYLNKIEGDSMMFHFDSIIDKRLWHIEKDEVINKIARELFYTCIEMQRVCVLFNQANDKFLDENSSAESRQALQKAFDIINTLRNKHELSSALNAFFQIRIRIGANIGEVTIGNFGPSGAKHWDVIGMPVINAKRMESTAPVGGLRISEEFYNILDKAGVVNDYHARFIREAFLLGSVYKNITKDELFSFRTVVVREKKGAAYKTYSVQVNSALPETLSSQVDSLLEQGEQGANLILDFFQYYRGNRYVVDCLEQLFDRKGIALRKDEMLGLIYPKGNRKGVGEEGSEPGEAASPPGKAAERSLFDIFQLMDRYQDIVQQNHEKEDLQEFMAYEPFMARYRDQIMKEYEAQKFIIVQRTYFFQVVYPLVYMSIKASILEYQLELERKAAESANDSIEILETIPELQ
jgi:class 3 adenylate cyclase